jgi:curved DNA-binding protein CbpA
MAPRPLLPADDLYARLEVPAAASPAAIEIAWRALLRRHHPDVAGPDGLAAATAINVAHDWLSDPDLRARYDRERGIRTGRRGRAAAWGDVGESRAATPRTRPTVRRAPPDRHAALAAFLDRVTRLTADELDRLDCAASTPIAFVASIERFLSKEQLAAVAAVEAEIKSRLPQASWTRPQVRDAVFGAALEHVLGEFLDEHLDEPFRGRVRERLTRGWDAAIGQPRYGPAGADIEALIRRVEGLSPVELRSLAAAAPPDGLGEEPWPVDTTPEDDEALRVSSVLAARDVARVVGDRSLDRTTLERARASAARLAHLVVLRPSYPAAEWERLTRPWRSVLSDERRRQPSVRRRR